MERVAAVVVHIANVVNLFNHPHRGLVKTLEYALLLQRLHRPLRLVAEFHRLILRENFLGVSR